MPFSLRDAVSQRAAAARAARAPERASSSSSDVVARRAGRDRRRSGAAQADPERTWSATRSSSPNAATCCVDGSREPCAATRCAMLHFRVTRHRHRHPARETATRSSSRSARPTARRRAASAERVSGSTISPTLVTSDGRPDLARAAPRRGSTFHFTAALRRLPQDRAAAGSRSARGRAVPDRRRQRGEPPDSRGSSSTRGGTADADRDRRCGQRGAETARRAAARGGRPFAAHAARRDTMPVMDGFERGRAVSQDAPSCRAPMLMMLELVGAPGATLDRCRDLASRLTLTKPVDADALVRRDRLAPSMPRRRRAEAIDSQRTSPGDDARARGAVLMNRSHPVAERQRRQPARRRRPADPPRPSGHGGRERPRGARRARSRRPSTWC